MPTSNDDLMRELISIKGEVGESKGKIDTFIGQMKVQDDRAADLDVRLRSVENKQYWASGASGIIGTMLGAIGLHIKW